MKKFIKNLGVGTTMETIGVVGIVAGVAGMIKTRRDISKAETQEDVNKCIKKGKNYVKLFGLSGMISGVGTIVTGAEMFDEPERHFLSGVEIKTLKNIIEIKDEYLAKEEDLDESKESFEEVVDEAVEEIIETVEETVE